MKLFHYDLGEKYFRKPLILQSKYYCTFHAVCKTAVCARLMNLVEDLLIKNVGMNISVWRSQLKSLTNDIKGQQQILHFTNSKNQS